MLKLAIFDLDQTLIDTLPRFYRIFNMSLKKYGCSEIEWDDFVVKYKEDILNDYVCVEKREFWDYFLSHYNDIFCERDRLIDGAYDTLSRLKELGVDNVIITGRLVPSSDVWEELKRFGIAEFIKMVYTRKDNYCDGRRRTELIIEAMKKLGARKENTVFVADYWPDMQSGREAGVFTVGVLTGHENAEKLIENGADVVIDSVKEFVPLLEERCYI